MDVAANVATAVGLRRIARVELARVTVAGFDGVEIAWTPSQPNVRPDTVLEAIPYVLAWLDVAREGEEFAWPIGDADEAMIQRILARSHGFHGRVASRELSFSRTWSASSEMEPKADGLLSPPAPESA